MGWGSEAYASRLSLFSNKFDIGVRIIITVRLHLSYGTKIHRKYFLGVKMSIFCHVIFVKLLWASFHNVTKV